MHQKTWNKITKQFDLIRKRRIKDLFDEPKRFEYFSEEAHDILIDFSKTNIDHKSRSLLLDLIEFSDLDLKRQNMFSGYAINNSENRAVLHWVLRAQEHQLQLTDKSVEEQVKKMLLKMEDFSTKIRSGEIKSGANEKFTDIINVGIGGSDLGPRMCTRALRPYHDGPRCHFVANVDSADLTDTLSQLKPEKTLVIIASKTFNTLETMTNTRALVKWLKSRLTTDFEKNLVAISSNPQETRKYGITPDRVFDFPDSIGGRYSMWGPIGLIILIAIGTKNFRKFLLGAAEMDTHFLTAKFEKNLPILLAMIGIWHRNVCRHPTRAILPYEQRLSILPQYLQQLDMESNGKRVTVTGDYVDFETAPIVWGEPGTNGQHAFYQMLHQGTSIVPCEFLIGRDGHELDLAHHHDLLIANCLAQSEALMNGRISDNTNSFESYREFPGNRPSVTIVYPKLTPKVLGTLIALFEHRTFVEGTVWGINSFDQWGVELGKDLSNDLLSIIQKKSDSKALNQSTAGLLSTLIKE